MSRHVAEIRLRDGVITKRDLPGTGSPVMAPDLNQSQGCICHMSQARINNIK